MNNIIISLIIAAVSTFFLVITEKKKENRTSVGIRSFVFVFVVCFIALTYLITEKICHDIEIGEPNF